MSWGWMYPGPIYVAASGNNVHLVYTRSVDNPVTGQFGSDIFYKRSTDGGITWNLTKRLTWSSAVYSCKITASGNNVHIAYTDCSLHHGHYDLYYKKSTDNGSTWVGRTQLASLGKQQLKENTDSPGQIYGIFQIVASTTTIHITYASDEEEFNSFDIYYLRSTDNGISWSSPQNLSNSGYAYSTYSYYGYNWLAVFNDNLYCVYSDYYYSPELVFVTSSDNGVTWSTPTPLAIRTDYSQWNGIVATSSYIHVVYMYNVDSTYGYDLFYLRGY